MDLREWREATVTQIERAAEDMLSITVKPERWVPHQPGQSYEIRIPGNELTRKYSIVSAPHQKEGLEFGVQLLPYGAVSPQMWQLKPGDPIELRGPFGTFVLDPSATGPVILLGGGSGITPLLSIRSHIRKLQPEREVVFIMTAKHAGRVMHYDKLKGELIARFTATEGRIDNAFLAHLLARFVDDPTVRCYVCGPDGFSTSTVDMLREAGFPEATISSEGFA